ncbi:MAG: MBL fold metallo-hydrolase [Rikenellaceae bacterium]|jgi:glyoxylase-like metal-dependent hydrolase (beta-lactamase superfamily II)|nr:MBL fold metallo-hydrolase [Rikenellaceae bacterium]
MKKSLFILFSASLFLTSCSGSNNAQIGEVVFENDQLRITQLEENAWVGETSDNTTIYIVEGDDRAALIDTGTSIDGLDEIVTGITDKPLDVILTHLHSDHAGNIRYFDEIYFHPADTVLGLRGYTGKVNYVAEGDVFDLGGTQLEVLHAPAHTPGEICLLDRAAGICYSGDAVGSNDVWLQLQPSAPIATYIATCDKILAEMDKGIDKIYCGHYVYIDGGVLHRDYVETMRELALSLEDGSGIPQAVPYDNAAYRNTAWKPLVLSKNGVNIVFYPEYLK